MNHNPLIFLWKWFLLPHPTAAILIASVRAQSFSVQLSWCGGNLLWCKGMEDRRVWEPDVWVHKSGCTAWEQMPFLPQIPPPAVAKSQCLGKSIRRYFLQITALNNLCLRHILQRCLLFAFDKPQWTFHLCSCPAFLWTHLTFWHSQ